MPKDQPRWRALKQALEEGGSNTKSSVHGALWRGVLKRITGWYKTHDNEDILLFSMWAWSRETMRVKEWARLRGKQPDCAELEEIFREVIEDFVHGWACGNPAADA